MHAFSIALILLAATVGAAQADCLQEIGQFREQVDSVRHVKSTPQTQAALRELRTLENNDMADEVDCYNTLARARKMLTASDPLPADDRYARDRRHP